MIDVEKLRAKPKEVSTSLGEMKIYPLKTRHIAQLGELQSKERFADATMLMIRETFNRMIEEEEVEKALQEGKTKQEGKENAKQKLLTDDDIDEFSQASLDELMPHIMEVNGLQQPNQEDEKKTSKQK